MDKFCTCGHYMRKHLHFRVSSEEKITEFIKERWITRTRQINEHNEKLYRFCKTLYTYNELFGMLEIIRQTRSKCIYNKKCSCQVFKSDNLRWLEELSVRASL